MATKTTQIAKMTGLHRCTGLGMTTFNKKGEELPFCNCPGECRWEFLKADNTQGKEVTTIFVGEGIFHAIETDELPEVGSFLNLKGALKGLILDGKYRVTAINTIKWNTKSGEEEFFHLCIERVSDITDDLPIHICSPMNC